MKYSSEYRYNPGVSALASSMLKSRLTHSLALVAAVTIIDLAPASAGQEGHGDRACSKSASRTMTACNFDAANNYWVIRANCEQLLDPTAKSDCRQDAKAELGESWRTCKAQLHARRDLCRQVGEQGYDVTSFWKPENFVDPLEIGNSVMPNPYFELVEGSKSYRGEDGGNTVFITRETKLIGGVTCLTVKDIAEEEGAVVEDTDDWYAQDVDGNVWYCGEISQNFEIFDGDNPAKPELTDTDGSWKAFADYAQPGILMKAAPQIGDVYRQEMRIEDAEDVAEVLDNAADGILDGDDCNDDGEEIATYIDSKCDSDCLITKEFSPIEPGVAEHKYYAPGIGLILEIKIADVDNPEEVGSCAVPVDAIEDDDDDEDDE